jgi:hypothetical protein
LPLWVRRRSLRNVLKFVLECCRWHGPGWSAPARRRPQTVGEHERIEDAMARPPGTLIARLMQGIVMAVAQRDGELIRYLEPERAGLGEANVMRVSRPPPADEAWLAGDEGEMRLIADAGVFGDQELIRLAR